jgi:putative transposase
VQLGFAFRNHGGRRAGSGRKPKNGRKAGVSHGPRPVLKARHPVHVTMKLSAGLPNIRHHSLATAVFEVLRKAKDRYGTRLVQLSVQANHVHMIVETEGKDALSSAMQWLAGLIAPDEMPA